MLKNGIFIMKLRCLLALFIVLIIYRPPAQAAEYILFDEDRVGNSSPAGPFSLYYNVAQIDHKTVPDLTWNIYNLYFTRHNFRLRTVYAPGLLNACKDYTSFENDIIVSITPLYLQNKEQEFVEIRDKQTLDTLQFVKPEELLQRAIRNIYAVDFAWKEECLPDTIEKKLNGRIKSLDYNLVVKKQGKYYLCRNKVLTEFYYACYSGFLFPNEAGFCGIYMPWSSQIYTPQSIRTTLPRQLEITDLRARYADAISGRLFSSGYDTVSVPGLSLVNFWTNVPNNATAYERLKYYYRSRQLRPYNVGSGINNFQFLPRVGIINGNFEFFLYEPMRNRQTDAPPDTDTVNFHFRIKAINNKPVSEFAAWYLKEYPPKVIPVE